MNRDFFRKFLDVLNEAQPQYNPKGVPIKSPGSSQPTQPGQDFGTQIINKGGQMVIDKMKGLGPSFRQTHQNLTPGSDYYQKNIANNPDLVKRAADVTSRMTPDQFDANVNDVQQRFTQATAPNRNLGATGTSAEYDNVADQVGLPKVQEEELDENGRMRKLLDMLDEAGANFQVPDAMKGGQMGPATITNKPTRPAPLASKKVNNQSSGYTAQSQAQKTQPQTTAVNNQSSGYTAQSQAQNTLKSTQPQTTAAAGSLAKDFVAANNPQAAQTAPAQTGPATAINPNDKNAAAFGKQINAPTQIASAQTAPAQTGPATAINPNDKNAAAFGKQINAPTQIASAQTAPAKTYGAGYDPNKVQYAYTGGVPNQQSAALPDTSASIPNTQSKMINDPKADFEESADHELNEILRLSGKQKQTTNENDSLKKFYSILNESTDNDEIELHDSFDIELNEHFVIETGIVGFTDDGIILEGDDTLLDLLEVNDIECEEGELVTEGLRDPKDNPCWKGYKPVGTKKKSGKTVPNCVPKESIEVAEDNVPTNDTEKKNTQAPKSNSGYLDTKPATDTKMDTSKLIDKEPLKDKPLKKDPKDYMVHEAPEGWGKDTMTMKDGSVMKYDPKSNSYSQMSGPTRADTKTSVSAINAQRAKATNSSRGDSTFDQEYSSTSVFRDPKTGAGDYLKTQLKGDDYTQDYQTDVSKPWLDYTLGKAQHDADTMMKEPGSYKSMPQGPMAQFRAKVNEAEYQGRKVPLGKPMAGDVKKSKVYVRKPNGKVVKVNFGDKNMKIKKSNPNRRKSFRARHRCENPGPRWKARYWSCKAW
jgi:hypothetical protein